MTVGKLCQRGSTYVDEIKELPFQKIRSNEEDEELVAIACERLQETGTIRVKLEDL